MAYLGYLLWHRLGRGQQRAAERWNVPRRVPWSRTRLDGAAGCLRRVDHMRGSKPLLVDLLDRTLQLVAELASHDQLRELLAAFHVLDAVPADVALGASVAPPGRAEPIVGVALCVLPLLGGGLVAPHLFLRFREAVPAMSDDTGDVAIVMFDGGGNLLCGGKRGPEEHERVSGTGDVVWVFVAQRGARWGDWHRSEVRC